MSNTKTQQVQLGSVEILPSGESFVLGLVASDQQVHRMELPSWTIHQLMRVLPRLDAALLQARQQITSDLVAYPVTRWSVERTGASSGVALSVRDDRRVESAYLFEGDDARALHAAFGEALAPQAEPVRIVELRAVPSSAAA